MHEILDLDLVLMAGLYKQIKESKRREEALRLYTVQYSFMVEKRIPYKGFREFYDELTGKGLDMRPAEVILAEVEEIRRELREG